MRRRRLKGLEEVVQFHGHVCPDLVFGYRVAQTALELMGERSQDEELVAVAGNRSCAVGAIQVVNGCTFGKGNFDAMPPVKECWRVRTRTPRLSLNVVWDEDHRGYIASVPEVSGVLAKGNSWVEALEKMPDVLRLQRYIGLLSNVLGIRGMRGVPKSSIT
jgi:formylmethanofuran dehydrogenase subunit E